MLNQLSTSPKYCDIYKITFEFMVNIVEKRLRIVYVSRMNHPFGVNLRRLLPVDPGSGTV